MSNQQDDLDLLLSLQDRVLETPPASPSNAGLHSSDSITNDGSPNRMGSADMSVFRDAVRDYLDYEPEPRNEAPKVTKSKNSNVSEVEKFSGLRIRNQLVSQLELADRFSDIKFVRLPAIKNLLMCDTLSGCWATVGVLIENGDRRASSNGKNYCISKFGCLDENTISAFLFGDAYEKFCKEKPGTVFALLNCNVRKDTKNSGFSLSVYNAGQMLKMGTSVDYAVCKGKRKDGMSCTLVIDKRRGIYCTYHKLNSSDKYTSRRTELMGSNLKTVLRGSLKSEGIHLVDPLADITNSKRASQPVRVFSVDTLKAALSNAGKLPNGVHSQGIRCLTELAGRFSSHNLSKGSVLPKQRTVGSGKRSSSTTKQSPSRVAKGQKETKRKKTEHGKSSVVESRQTTEKMIELDYASSDDDF